MIRLVCMLLCWGCAFVAAAQKKPKDKKGYLFTVAGQPVSADEFVYLFRKNHPETPAGYAEAEVLEYLDLFIRFKLKVTEATHRGMDTTRAFLAEYRAYRDEIIKPFLPDNRITDSLVQLTYERLQREISASHLLINVPPDAPPADTLKAWQKITALRQRIESGEDFGELAASVSDDPSARVNRGDLGYFTALQMVFPFETAAYTTPVGEVSQPVRTRFGYHLIRVNDSRPGRGEVEVAHLMLRAGNGKTDAENKDLIFRLYDQLIDGASWDDLCQRFSEDQNSNKSGGLLRPFGVRAMASAPPFEEMAFALEQPGDLSVPFQTPFGWHIVRLEKRIPLPALSDISAELKTRVSKDERFESAREAWMSRLKTAWGWQEDLPTKAQLLEACDAGDCAGVTAGVDKTLFTIRRQPYTIADFLAHLRKQTVKSSGAARQYEDFVKAAFWDELEKEISGTDKDFSMLSKEYYEGILLFEIMEQEVWNKAADDSAGQRAFFRQNREQYATGERAKASLYSASDSAFRAPLRAVLAAGDSVGIVRVVGDHAVREERGIFQKGENALFARIPWRQGIFTAENNGKYYLAWIRQILPAGIMSFEEAKAAIVTDFQQELEDQWIEQLRKQYPVKVNEKTKREVLAQLQR